MQTLVTKDSFLGVDYGKPSTAPLVFDETQIRTPQSAE